MNIKNKKRPLFSLIFALFLTICTLSVGSTSSEAAVSYLEGVNEVKEEGDFLVIKYKISRISKNATVHFSVINQFGQDIDVKGNINKPVKTGVYEYKISKGDLDINKRQGYKIEYKASNGKVLDGIAKHLNYIGGKIY